MIIINWKDWKPYLFCIDYGCHKKYFPQDWIKKRMCTECFKII